MYRILLSNKGWVGVSSSGLGPGG